MTACRLGLLLVPFAAAISLLATSASGQDATHGEEVFKKCRACHEVGPEAKNKVGPALLGLFGRKAGTADGFNYSDAMREAGTKGLIWDDAKVDRYLENPRGFVPGNKMAFPGLKDEVDRRAVIAYLRNVAK